MTIPLNSREHIDHDEFMKTRSAVIKEQSDADVKAHIESVNYLIDAIENAHVESVIDFSRNEEARHHIDNIHNKSPRVFGHGGKKTVFSKEDGVEFVDALKKEFGLTDSSEEDAKPSPLETFVSNYVVPEKGGDTRLDEEYAAYLNAEEIAVADAGIHKEVLYKEQQIPPETVTPAEPVDETKSAYRDQNLGLAFIAMQTKAFDLTEARINKLVDQLAELNAVNKDLSDLLNGLTMCKESGKADFSKDDEMQAIIDRLFGVNPKIFGNQKSYVFNDGKQIDMVLASIDGEIKGKVAEVNQVTMFINVRFDERVQYSENARKVLEMLIRHCESIISKYHKT